MAETTVRKNTKKPEVKAIPADAEIVSRDTTVDVEEIENGYLITKRTETKWRAKGKDNYPDWHSETKKWYSKNDPLTIKTKDAELADAFEE